MRLQAPDVIGVRMGEKEGIDIKAFLVIAIQELAELGRHIRRLVVLVVCCRPDIDVDENATAGFELDERHVAVTDLKVYASAGGRLVRAG